LAFDEVVVEVVVGAIEVVVASVGGVGVVAVLEVAVVPDSHAAMMITATVRIQTDLTCRVSAARRRRITAEPSVL
jgi:hypothetical protein